MIKSQKSSTLDPAQIYKKTQNQRPHIYREVFEGHKAEIVSINYLHSSKEILTLDAAGNLLRWAYTREQISNNVFVPSLSIKLTLNVLSFQAQDKPKPTFPLKLKGNELQTQSAAQLQRFQQIAGQNFENALHSAPVTPAGTTEYLFSSTGRPPTENQALSCEVFHVSGSPLKVVAKFEQSIVGKITLGKLYPASTIRNGLFLVVPMLAPHNFYKDRESLSVFFLNTSSNKLRKLCLSTVIMKGSFQGLQFLENFSPFPVPYFMFSDLEGVTIYSGATGQVVQRYSSPIAKAPKGKFFESGSWIHPDQMLLGCSVQSHGIFFTRLISYICEIRNLES